MKEKIAILVVCRVKFDELLLLLFVEHWLAIARLTCFVYLSGRNLLSVYD